MLAFSLPDPDDSPLFNSISYGISLITDSIQRGFLFRLSSFESSNGEFIQSFLLPSSDYISVIDI